MMNKGGRPKAYSDEDLLKVLQEYIKKHENQKIVLSKLVRETGIARHIWDYSKKVQDIIEKLNNPVIFTNEINDEIKTIPSVESLIEQNSSNPKKLRLAIESCLNVINSLKEKVAIMYKLEEEKLAMENEIIRLKEENKKLKKQVKNQEIVMMEICIDSESRRKREGNGIKNNIIKIDIKDNVDKVIAVTESDIIKQFPWLADEE